MGQKIASLEIELAMATGGAVADLNRFGGAVDKVSAQALRDLDKIDASMKNVGGLDAATASAVRFAEQTAKSAISAARELNRIEKSGEAMAAQLDRQLSVFGKTTAEVRALKAETAALAAEQAGASELADRIRAKEAELSDREFAAARAARIERENEAEERQRAADIAAAAAAREAQALREAASAHAMFEARVREGAQAMREADAAAAAFDQMVARVAARADPAAAAIGRLKGELAEAQRALDAGRISGGLFEQEQARIVAAVGRVYGPQQQANRALDDGADASRRNGFAMRNLGQQFGDFGTQVSLGSGFLRAFSSQAGQVGYALSEFESGPLASVGEFLTGPWGVALTVAAVALGPLLEKVVSFGSALDVATEKLRTQAEEAETTRQAHERFAATSEGVEAALREQTRALDEAAAAEKSVAERANIAAKINLEREIGIRRTTAALLEQAIAQEEVDKVRAQAPGQRGENAALSLNVSSERAAALRVELESANAKIVALERNVQRTRIDLAVDMAKRVTDPMERIKALYDGQATAAKNAARAQAAAGQQIDGVLTHELVVIERNRAAAIKAEQEKQAASRETANQIGRNVSLAEARGIAEGVGGRVTSDHRTFAEQQRLYDKYQAYRAGTGPWAALAAKPGTSNHELDHALDVAKTDGVTLKKLVDAYRAAGVKLIEALDEGSHFHIAWKDVGDKARQNTEAAKAAKDELKDYQDALRAEWEQGAGLRDLLARGSQPLDIQLDTKLDMPEVPDILGGLRDQLDDSRDAVIDYAHEFGRAFGDMEGSVGRLATAFIEYGAERDWIAEQAAKKDADLGKIARANAENQIGAFAEATGAVKGFFKEHSTAYKAMQAAETAFRAVQLAMSIQAMVQNALEVSGVVAGAAAKATAEGTAGVAKQSQLPFPANLVAMAATAAALVAAGVAVIGNIGGGGNTLPKANDGSGTVLGDATAQSESVKRSIDQLREIDDVTLTVTRQMLGSLRSIESNIGGLASLLVRTGNIDASAGVNTGFKSNAVGGTLGYIASGGVLGEALKKVPIIGDALGAIGGVVKSLFGTKTTVIASGLYGGAQSLGDVLSGGFDADYYSDVKKKKKFLGLSAGTSYKTQYSEADGGIEDQFTLLLRQFYETIGAAAGPLGVSLNQVESKLSGFTVELGKIDLKGLTGAEIQEKLEAVFGAAADGMAEAAVPGLSRFQKVGEGAFETLVRVASTVEAVDAKFQLLGRTSGSLGVDVDMAIAGLFDSLSDFTGAADAYFEAYYSDAEQTAAKTAQLGRVFTSLGAAMPDTLAGFRALVEAQDLTTAAGQGVYATLLQVAPAFADLQEALGGAKSAADILSERQDLERKLLELSGDTAAIRAAEIAKLDPSNRALQQQIYAIQDAQTAAKAAEQLRDAWASVGDTIMDEVRRIRGLTDAAGGGSFAAAQGQFNAATAAARAGDIDAAKTLPALSQALLKLAADAATSRQELDRVQAQTAASLEATYGAIGSGPSQAETLAKLVEIASTQAAASTSDTSSNLQTALEQVRGELVQLRSDMNSGNAAIASNTGRVAKRLDDVTAASGGDALSVQGAAA